MEINEQVSGTAQPDNQVPREPPEVPKQREDLVKRLIKRTQEAKEYWGPVFRRMREDMKMAKGWQLPSDVTIESEMKGDQYKANLAHRHLRQRVSSLYAKNPKVVAKRRPRLDFILWDEDPESLVAAQTLTQEADPMMVPPMVGAQAQALMQEYMTQMAERQRINKVCKTLEILFGYFMDEGNPTFKVQLKQMIVRVLTTGVGFVKLNFQRVMDKSPDLMGKLQDATQALASMERIAADIADEELPADGPDAEQLRLQVEALQQQFDLVLREGLVFDFPSSTQIIVDTCCKQLKGFVGAEWIAQEFVFSPEKIQEIYGVDVKVQYTKYDAAGNQDKRKKSSNMAMVFVIYDMVSGLEYHVCAGYPDFLKPPAKPEVFLEQFHPLFALTFNDIEDEDEIYPPSNIRLLRSMQLEYNRAREAVREHRIANRPALVSSGGTFKREDKTSLANHTIMELLELEGLPPGTKIADVLQAKPTMQIDPAVYEVEGVFMDLQRVVGDQEANLGGTSDATATESSIAEQSRVSSIQSNIDDLDEFLSAVARAGGQVLLAEMSAEQVTKIVGPGASWPQLAAQDIAEEVFLEIKAGSTGRPNKAQEISNFERMAPFLLQVPGVDPKWMLEEMVRRLDDGMDITDAFKKAAPSITAMNAQAKPDPAGDPAASPNQQAAAGAENEAPVQESQPGPEVGAPEENTGQPSFA